MTGKKWIPHSALLDGRVEQTLTQCLDQWQEAWFGHTIGRALLVDATDFGAQGQVFSTDEGIRIVLGEGGRVPIIAACLSFDPLEHVATETDKQCLHNLVSDALSDLAERVGNLAGLEDLELSERHLSTVVETAISVSLCDPDGTAWFDLRLNPDIATKVRLSHMVPAAYRELKGNLEEALERQDTHLRAKAGQVTASLQDIQSMKPGDVLPLNTKLADSFSLLANGRPVAGVRCRYVRVQDEASDGEARAKSDTPISGGFIMEADHG